MIFQCRGHRSRNLFASQVPEANHKCDKEKTNRQLTLDTSTTVRPGGGT
jgi:hypothetical protein